MIPEIGNYVELSQTSQPWRTWRLDTESGRIRGFVDGIDALKQAVLKMLETERYVFPIYSFDYGFESADLIGKDSEYVNAELERRISDALLQDDRIVGVDGFTIERTRDRIHASFTVHSTLGDTEVETYV